jgi:uncharacterized protein with gpF-like domain
MYWLRRLTQPFTQPGGLKGHSRSEPVTQALPSVTLDPIAMNKRVKSDLRRNIELFPDLERRHFEPIYQAVLRGPRNLHFLSAELMKIDGMTRERAVEIARSLSNKTTAMINRDRQASLGITHAIWMYPNAPCMREPFSSSPTAADIRQDTAHRSANGKRYEISKGLFVDGKWTWPGVEEGCKCVARAILPQSED